MGRNTRSLCAIPAFSLSGAVNAVSRRELLLAIAGVATAVSPVRAAEAEGGKRPKKGQRGSKDAKGYQLCLSQCLYDCTVPRPGLAKGRAQCRTECKDECAVSRDQL